MISLTAVVPVCYTLLFLIFTPKSESILQLHSHTSSVTEEGEKTKKAAPDSFLHVSVLSFRWFIAVSIKFHATNTVSSFLLFSYICKHPSVTFSQARQHNTSATPNRSWLDSVLSFPWFILVSFRFHFTNIFFSSFLQHQQASFSYFLSGSVT